MKIEIKAGITGAVLFSHETEGNDLRVTPQRRPADHRVQMARRLLGQMLDKDLKRYGIQTAKAEGAQVNVQEIEAAMLRGEFGDAQLTLRDTPCRLILNARQNNMELHPLCTLFPRLNGEEFDALVADIKTNGLSEPITVHNGMILDGGNRYRACMEAGVDPQLIEFDGENIVQFVLSKNLHRRHLSAGQRAAIVASTQDWASAHGHGGGRNFQSATLHLEKTTSESRAAESGASVRTQKKADKVAKADPALAKRVAHGEISLERAAEQVGEKPRGKNPPARSEADELREQLNEAREMLSAMADELAILSDIKHGDEAKRLAQLQSENKALRTQLDDYMTLNAQLKRQVAMLKKQLGG